MDLPDSNGLAGLAALVNSLLMAPAVMSLRKLARRHDEKIEEHDERLENLEDAKPRKRRIRK